LISDPGRAPSVSARRPHDAIRDSGFGIQD
jgi:hypothetical protein